MSTNAIPTNVPTEAEEQAMKDRFFAELRRMSQERLAAIAVARPALARLVVACAHRTNQSYHLRALLFSMWNGQPADLSDSLRLDWSLKQDFCAVLLAFGHDKFFYDALEQAFNDAGLGDWFAEEFKGKELSA